MTAILRLVEGTQETTLEDVLLQATQRQLERHELDRLADLAWDAGCTMSVVGKLAFGGSFEKINLRNATRLREAHCRLMDQLPGGRNFVVRPKRAPVRRAPSQQPRVIFTLHAIERYIERLGLNVSVDEGHTLLCDEVRHAVRVKDKTEHGDDQWICPSGAVLVVKRDRASRYRPCVVTVLDAEMRLRSLGVA